MGNLRARLRRLEHETRSEVYELLCSECGQEFTLLGDAPAEYLVWEWSRGAASVDENHHETPPAMLRAFEHEHDPGAFIEKRSGLPFLSKTVSGFDLGAAHVS